MPNEVEQRLREIEERANAASPGPWEVYDENEGDFPPRPLWSVANEHYHGPEDDEAPAFQATVYFGGKADADFIAHARQDVPFLLSLLREREEENRRLREALAAIRDYAAPRSDLSVYVEIMYEMASDAIRGEQP